MSGAWTNAVVRNAAVRVEDVVAVQGRLDVARTLSKGPTTSAGRRCSTTARKRAVSRVSAACTSAVLGRERADEAPFADARSFGDSVKREAPADQIRGSPPRRHPRSDRDRSSLLSCQCRPLAIPTGQSA